MKYISGKPFVQTIASDDKWVMCDYNKRQAKWVDKGAQPPDVSKREIRVKNGMLSVWWSTKEWSDITQTLCGSPLERNAKVYFEFLIKIRNLMREGRPRPISVDMSRRFCLIHCIALTFYFLIITHPATSNVILIDENLLQNNVSKIGCFDFELAVTGVLEGRHPQFSGASADSH
ncbi:Protein CBG11911 [Caenorhabditis briggsae]|uniref:Protein CBG11911 n=1 Tax=Caenorhabditis briggsae TaxID=6238 RepID=A8XEK8_CAEBR|nr:Protein CBG11911 [Caenorhabditis briggsae]CAP30976.1 Protein CBG11911 [Caenorhabditis briggsae]